MFAVGDVRAGNVKPVASAVGEGSIVVASVHQVLRRITFMSDRGCSHLDAIDSIKQPQRRECEECVKIGAEWAHLRTCQTCGATLCCDSSPNRHASKHAHATGHPVIASAQPGERWLTAIRMRCFANIETCV